MIARVTLGPHAVIIARVTLMVLALVVLAPLAPVGLMSAGAAPALIAPVAPSDLFRGHVTTATGRFRHDSGSFVIDIAASPATSARPLRLTIRGRVCSSSRRCLALGATLHGTLTRLRLGIPDLGSSFAIAARGRTRALGRTRASGTVTGTGFIVRGIESMQLTLAGRGGSIGIAAASSPVPGFTSP
jgi:hypothetical protein